MMPWLIGAAVFVTAPFVLLGLWMLLCTYARRPRRSDWIEHERSAMAVANPPRPRRIWCELIPFQGKWRWLLWDDEITSSSDDQALDGVLIPYLVGAESTLSNARLAAYDAVVNSLDFPAVLARYKEGSLR